MPRKKYVSNYSIENIAQSIVHDHPLSKRYSPDDRKRLYLERLKLLEHFPLLTECLTLDRIHGYPNAWARKIARVGILPPELVVVDNRIQDMCYLPFWTYYGSGEGSFGRCAGVGNFSCCPPFNPRAEKVQSLLNKADFFIVLQSRPALIFGSGDPGELFRFINGLSDTINDLLGKGTVLHKFGGGPCFACHPEPCEGEGKCRAPHLKTPSLEGMGICVDQLCKDLALLTGDEGWKITWIKGFGTPEQRPKKMKGTVGLALTVRQR